MCLLVPATLESGWWLGVAPRSRRFEPVRELRLVDPNADVQALAGPAVLDPHRLRRNVRQRFRIRILPLAKPCSCVWRIERRDELGAKPDVEQLSGHMATLDRRLP
jgi:hypothetical protein